MHRPKAAGASIMCLSVECFKHNGQNTWPLGTSTPGQYLGKYYVLINEELELPEMNESRGAHGARTDSLVEARMMVHLCHNISTGWIWARRGLPHGRQGARSINRGNDRKQKPPWLGVSLRPNLCFETMLAFLFFFTLESSVKIVLAIQD